MGTRIDWINDPNAPEPNSLIPAANVIIVDNQERVLMIRRTDNGNYCLPGGAMEMNERITEAAIREAKEETGYDVEITGIAGIYTNPDYRIEYTSNGEVRREFTIVFAAKVIGGEPRINEEASEVVWVRRDEAKSLPMTSSQTERIANYLDGETYLG